MKLQIKQGIKNIGRGVWNIYWRRQMRKFYRHHVSAIQPEQLTIYPEKKRKETSRIKSEILELQLSEKGGGHRRQPFRNIFSLVVTVKITMFRTTCFQKLPRIYTIGWDVAVTEDGPIIIEGNADYGPVTYQSVTGKGERSLFEKYFSSQL